jgi:hypothetical protein
VLVRNVLKPSAVAVNAARPLTGIPGSDKSDK